MLSEIISPVFEKTINAALLDEPGTVQALQKLAGKTIALHLKGLEICWHFHFTLDKVLVTKDADTKPDVLITALPGAFIKLASTSDAMSLLQSGELEMSGDVRVGQDFKELMENVDIDWEELLAQRIGDIPAHTLARAVRDIKSWLLQGVDSTQSNVGEYLQEEIQLLPATPEIEGFLQSVDALRSDVERMAARLNRLRTVLK